MSRARIGAMLILAVFLAAAVLLLLRPASAPVPIATANRVAAPAMAPRPAVATVPVAASDLPHPAAVTPVAVPAAAVPDDAPYVVKRVLPIEGPMHHGDYLWDDHGVPAGPVVVTVDLAAQTMSVFRAGYEIGAAVILYGADEKPTPLGVFRITQKDAHHVSNLYNAPMPYMLRLTNDGVSIHGSAVEDGYVTHGCVGVPTAFARLLFEQVGIGDRVIVTRGERLALGGRIKAA